MWLQGNKFEMKVVSRDEWMLVWGNRFGLHSTHLLEQQKVYQHSLGTYSHIL